MARCAALALLLVFAFCARADPVIVTTFVEVDGKCKCSNPVIIQFEEEKKHARLTSSNDFELTIPGGERYV